MRSTASVVWSRCGERGQSIRRTLTPRVGLRPARRAIGPCRDDRLTHHLANGTVFAMRLILDKMSRLVVPKPLRDRFALAPGHELEVVVEADGFRLRPVHAAPALAVKNGLLVCTSELPATAWDLGAFLDQERDQRSRQLGGV